MYDILLRAHSGMRWLVLIAIVAAIIMGFMQGKDASANRKNTTALVALILTHIQVLVGLILYFLSPKVAFVEGMMSSALLRFFTVEHIAMMLIGAVVLTIGYAKSKKKDTWGQANKTVAIYYLIALLLFLIRIPWPMQDLGASWF